MLSTFSNRIVCIYSTHVLVHVQFILCTLAFVARLTTEELPHQMKKHIEEGLQEWERDFCKVFALSYLVELSL